MACATLSAAVWALLICTFLGMVTVTTQSAAAGPSATAKSFINYNAGHNYDDVMLDNDDGMLDEDDVMDDQDVIDDQEVKDDQEVLLDADHMDDTDADAMGDTGDNDYFARDGRDEDDAEDWSRDDLEVLEGHDRLRTERSPVAGWGVRRIVRGVKRKASKATQGIVRGTKRIAKGVVKTVARTTKGAARLTGRVTKAVVRTVSRTAKGVAKGIGRASKGIGRASKGIGKGIGRLTKGTSKGLGKLTKGISTKGIGRIISKTTKGLRKGVRKVISGATKGAGGLIAKGIGSLVAKGAGRLVSKAAKKFIPKRLAKAVRKTLLNEKFIKVVDKMGKVVNVVGGLCCTVGMAVPVYGPSCCVGTKVGKQVLNGLRLAQRIAKPLVSEDQHRRSPPYMYSYVSYTNNGRYPMPSVTYPTPHMISLVDRLQDVVCSMASLQTTCQSGIYRKPIAHQVISHRFPNAVTAANSTLYSMRDMVSVQQPPRRFTYGRVRKPSPQDKLCQTRRQRLPLCSASTAVAGGACRVGAQRPSGVWCASLQLSALHQLSELMVDLTRALQSTTFPQAIRYY